MEGAPMSLGLVWMLAAVAPPAGHHPLDGLRSSEYWAVRDVLRSEGRLAEGTRIAAIELEEPAKADVLAWSEGGTLPRAARVALSRGRETFEAVVDVGARRLASWRAVPGAIANLVDSEGDSVEALAKADPRMVEGFRRRGIEDLHTVNCYGISPGYFGTPEEEGRRLAMVRCWDRRGVYNADARPIEGLYAWVDIGAGKVLRVVDAGSAPLPGAAEIHGDALPPRRDQPPILVTQPGGPGFRVAGGEVEWQGWRFHVRLEPRRGAVVSLVRHLDGGRLRSVLYQGSLSEIFVPYMDPGEGWYNITYLDLGEYTAEGLLSPLEPGEDCPAGAAYLEGIVPDEHGVPWPRRRTACLFEREGGQVAWRHFNWLVHEVDSRHGRELVLRTIANLGNYDYVFDWVFQQDGSLRVVVGSTGVVAVKAVASRTPADDAAGDGAYGRFVAPHTVAVNHDHFFSFRLDLDVDGPLNSFVVDRLVSRRPSQGPRKSVWVVEPEAVTSEKGARRERHEAGLWRFVNPATRGPMGYPASYQIRPGHGADALLSDDDFPQRRAGFTRHALWVTPYRADERYAAGDYPSQSRGGDGLPAWTAADRPIENADIVAWYTVGMHHVVRAEDWPVMPVVWHEFEIRPFDFFARNPALDLPTSR
jgi:primary-amine oxidase